MRITATGSGGKPRPSKNPCIGFLAAVTFLGINGFEFDAPGAEVVAHIVMLAEGRLPEAQLAEWIRVHSARSR